MTPSCNSSDNLAMSTTGYAYAWNPEFDTQVNNQKFIFIPDEKLIRQWEHKAELAKIKVVIVE